MPNRKRRNDRNHVVYLVTCDTTGDTYVGITVARGRAYQASMMERWRGHIYHATVENRHCPIHVAIRRYGADNFSHKVLCVVRGKEATHAKERELVRELSPTLNVALTGQSAVSV